MRIDVRLALMRRDELRDRPRAVQPSREHLFFVPEAERGHAITAFALPQRDAMLRRLGEELVDALAVGEAERRQHERLERRLEALRDVELTVALEERVGRLRPTHGAHDLLLHLHRERGVHLTGREQLQLHEHVAELRGLPLRAELGHRLDGGGVLVIGEDPFPDEDPPERFPHGALVGEHELTRLDEQPHLGAGSGDVDAPRLLGLLEVEQELQETDGDGHGARITHLGYDCGVAAAFEVPRGPEESRAFLQARVAGFGRTLAAFVLGFYVFANGFAMLHPLARWSDWVSPLNVLVLAGGTVCLLEWLLSRTGKRSESELETLDAIATIATGATIGLTSIYGPPVQRPELSSIMGVVIFLILRGTVIPSSGARTATMSTLAVLPAIYGAYACHAREPLAPYKLPVPLYPALTAVWAGLGVVAATLASRTIFGLRKKASEAQKLGQYTLGEKVGEGGMGAVYRASHAMMKREVAIKLLPAERAGKEGVARFEREVQLTSRLESPNTIAIYDYGRTPDGTFYYVMEYLDGYSLEDLVTKFGPQPPGRVIHLVKQVCVALAEAHGIGLIHRDVKPANLALCERAGVFDVVKVLDFGLVKELGTDVQSTSTSALTGTPLYLAPESITSPEKVDARSDLYALGGVAYWLVTGTHVFSGSTIVEVCSHHLHSTPETPTRRLGGQPVPADLEAIVMRCLDKDPEKRFQSADALYEALDACDSAEDWPPDAAERWWAENRDAAVAARRDAKTSRPSRLPGPLAIDLDSRRKDDA